MNWLRRRKKARNGSRGIMLAAAALLFLGTVPVRGLLSSGTVPVRGLSLFLLPPSGQPVPRRLAIEVPLPANEPDEATLARPVALALDGGRLYVADAVDCAVKIFSTEGRFLGVLGRKGQGPGELSFPSGVAIVDGLVVVADKFNFRIQIIDRDGAARGGFKLPFAPDRIVPLDSGRLLITANPTGRQRGERLLSIYTLEGRRVWSGLEARAASDPMTASFRNMFLACPDGSGGFFVIYRCSERDILHFSSMGASLGRVAVDGRLATAVAILPAPAGDLRLEGFCWAAAIDRGRLYISPPEAIEGKDLGPGRTIAVLDESGRLGSIIELPCAVHRFLAAGGRLFAIDDEGGLRIFEVGR